MDSATVDSQVMTTEVSATRFAAANSSSWVTRASFEAGHRGRCRDRVRCDRHRGGRTLRSTGGIAAELASTARRESAISGRLRASQRPFAALRPTRTPVNEPGPDRTTTASSDARLRLALVARSRMVAMSRSDAVRPGSAAAAMLEQPVLCRRGQRCRRRRRCRSAGASFARSVAGAGDDSKGILPGTRY